MARTEFLLNYRQRTPTGSVTAVLPCVSAAECSMYEDIMLEDDNIVDVLRIEKITSTTVIKSSSSSIKPFVELSRLE